jgi:hypothetical protein
LRQAARLAGSRIKGAAFREFVRWLGEEGVPLDALVASLPANRRSSFRTGDPYLGILAATWYDAADVHAFLEALARGRSPAEVDRLCREGSVAALHATLTGVHRAVLRVVGSPELHARFAQRLWSTYYEDGIATSVRVGPTRQRIAYRQWRSHHRLLCAITAVSDLVVFGQMGLRDVRVTFDTCVDRGDADCGHFVDWT